MIRIVLEITGLMVLIVSSKIASLTNVESQSKKITLQRIMYVTEVVSLQEEVSLF